MKQHFPLMIPGATASGSIDVTAPWDGAVIATIDTAGETAIETALATADALFRDRIGWLDAQTRIGILNRAADIMQSRFDELALEAAREGGKPLVDSNIEVTRAIDGMRNCAEVLKSSRGEEIPMQKNAASMHRLAFTTHEPIGVVVAFSAFNHPLNLAVHQLGPAIAAGCPVIIKPAPDTPLSCMRLVSMLREAGLPEAWCQAGVAEDNDIALRLASDPRVAFLSFIGSSKVGWMLRSKPAPGARCALEHGGVAPVIVAEDADLDDALPMIAKAGFYHAGQVCVSVQRVYAHASIARNVAERIADAGGHMKVGDPTRPETGIGPLIRHGETERVHAWVKDAVSYGAELVRGGRKLSDSTYAATVLYNVPDEAIIASNEIFGPVIQVNPYDHIDEAIASSNALDVSFQAAVFSKNIDTCLYAFKHLNGSAIMINDHTAFRVDWMPFAGLKHSGLGIGGIPHTFRDMQVQKMMVMRSMVL
jgi:acyl-CoA reductase-like NAD-dependent aldehyde dehydrogenase